MSGLERRAKTPRLLFAFGDLGFGDQQVLFED
jgi:hypothetical protein